MKIDPDRCYLFLYDVQEQAVNGDFTSIVRVEIESVSHCGNWASVRWTRDHPKIKTDSNSVYFRSRPRYVNTRLLMTKEEADLTKKSTVPKVGDLVTSLFGANNKKNYLVSKVNKASIHRLDPETGKNMTVSFKDIIIIARNGKTYDEN